MEEGSYRKELAKHKWNAYINDVEENQPRPLPNNCVSIPKP